MDPTVLLLDGGFSKELENYIKFDVHKEPLWTAKALSCDCKAVVDTHLAYLKAGADIIETSTYQATIPGFVKYSSIDEKTAESLMTRSVELAKNAVEEFLQSNTSRKGVKPLIAGSVGPYGAHLCDGSEYKGTYMDTVSKEEIINLHLPRIRALVKGGVDVLAIETMPSIKEVDLLLSLIKNEFPTTTTWVSFSVKENNPELTACGESIIEAFKTIANYSQVWGFGINCCSPQYISPFLTEIASFRSLNSGIGDTIKLIVYPNTGQDWLPGKGWIKDPVPTLDTYVNEWMKLGASVVGGCCQVGAEETKKMRPLVDKWNDNKLKVHSE